MRGGQTLSLVPAEWSYSIAEARTNSMQVGVMERELKKQKKPGEYAELNQRLHEVIMGLERPRKEDRVRIAVIINGDENMVVEDRIKNQVYSRLREKFPIDYFAVYKGTDINSKLLQYAEDIYYDQREYATTRDTEYNHSKTDRGINASVNGLKNIFKTATNSSHAANTATTIAGTKTGNPRRFIGNDTDADGDYDSTQYISDTNDDTYNSNINSDTNGTGNSNSNTDHKGWGAKVGVGFGTSTVSGDESRVTKSSKVDIDGVPVGNRPRGLADMRRMDYVRAGRECNYDYVFVMTLSNGKGKIYNHDLLVTSSNTVTKNVWLRLRLVDVKSGNYLYRNDIAAMGKTHNGYINGKVLERSVAKAVQEAMDDIKITEK
ncbi:hypothetical protein SELR_28170 [Selenomonas ruminantium subsp. lactilytica TAM6421]|uniref:Uncharacterized protein n=2 Tax=Selenomonas ruminantium TaxID=971 RepID=I0GUT8_SELRL|nr:hypothetical protein SELR_28170 [Selenomonas ruminantium subsp. lactilytica TAM6421]